MFFWTTYIRWLSRTMGVLNFEKEPGKGAYKVRVRCLRIINKSQGILFISPPKNQVLKGIHRERGALWEWGIIWQWGGKREVLGSLGLWGNPFEGKMEATSNNRQDMWVIPNFGTMFAFVLVFLLDLYWCRSQWMRKRLETPPIPSPSKIFLYFFQKRLKTWCFLNKKHAVGYGWTKICAELLEHCPQRTSQMDKEKGGNNLSNISHFRRTDVPDFYWDILTPEVSIFINVSDIFIV